MIINRTKDWFGGLATIISGKNNSFNFDGQYGISTSKAGLFSGLSTRITEFPKGSFFNRRTVAEFIYEDHVTKNERYKIHDAIVKILDKDIDYSGDILDQLEHITRLYKLSGEIKQAFRT